MNSAEVTARLEQLSDVRLRGLIECSALAVHLKSGKVGVAIRTKADDDVFVDCDRFRRLVVDVLTEAGAFNGEARGQTNMLAP